MFYVISNPRKGGYGFSAGPFRTRAEADAAAKTTRAIHKRNPVRSVKGGVRVQNIGAGYYDDEGVFHPIRASYDYDAKRLGHEGPRQKKAERKAKRRKPTTKRKAKRSRSRNRRPAVRHRRVSSRPRRKVARRRR